MRRLIAIALPAVLLLGAPSSAPAKGIMSAKVCGADGCKTVHPTENDVLGGGPATDGPSRPEPFVRLNVRIGVPHHSEPVRLLFLPRSELLLADDGETWMVPLALSELRAIARRVKPFAASELSKAVPLAAAAAKSDSEPLAPETVQAPAPASAPAPAPAPPRASAPTPAPATARDGGFEAWWLAPAAAIVLAAGFLVARRRRREPAPAAARAIG
jgi:hypothetical protein